ncbi:MAG: ATPase, T2SS/T4P/T4SS family [Candidatus Staskawiczbacteria bacterium]|nr:ATPase, T2SS/T4P/T4SS family [Candidatus Staskawiczbacteria bacterium]
MKLLQELFAQGFLTEKMLNDLKTQSAKLGKTEEEIILSKNIVSEDFLFGLKSKISGVPLKKIDAEKVSSDVLELIPEEASVNYKMASVEKDGKSVLIGMVYPEDIAAQNALRFLANQENFTYQICLITPGNLANLSKQRKNISSETKKALESLSEESGKIFDAPKKKFAAETITEDAPIIKMVLVILRHALEGNASDIHIEPGRDKLNVRFRLNGILYLSLSLPLKVHPAIVARIKILSALKIDENRMPQDGRFSVKINNSDVDFRVSTFPTLYGEKVEIRVLDPSTGARSFEDLGMTGRSLEVVKAAIKKPYGMILFTGPTGSGKTTTQYAILRILNQDSVNIVTVEDPIEYSIAGINQSQVKPEIGYTFARGLRQILRQDPNIIMVGEVRDEETASLVINAALTGHIVLSTLHTNSSVGVIPRLIDMGVRPFLIPSTLKVVISQRLIRVLCPHCKIKVRPSEKIKSYILEKIKNMPASAKSEVKIEEPLFIYAAKGCEVCGFLGYSGRMGLFEVLSMSDELAELMQTSLLESMIFKVAQKQGMLTMEQEGILKVLNGQTTIEEVIRATEEK